MITYKKIAALSAAAVIGAGMLSGCGTTQVYQDATDVENDGINVTAATAEMRGIEATASYTGELIAKSVAYVTGKASAKVERVNAELGDWVEKGEVLAVLDDTDYSLQYSQAKAGYSQAEAAYNSAVTACENIDGVNAQTEAQLSQAVKASEIAYNDAKANFERQTALYEKGAISLVIYESAKSAHDNALLAYEGAKKNYEIATKTLAPGNKKSAESAVTTAQAALNQASVGLKQAESLMANTVVRAPISGYVSAKNVVLGQFAQAGMALFTIADTSELEVEIKVTEAVVPYVSVGSKAVVEAYAADESLEGDVKLVNPVKDAVSGMYIVRINVPNTDGKLKVGMFADVSIVTDESEESALCVPSVAVVKAEEGNYVYVIDGNEAKKVLVECGVTDGEFTHIKSGLNEGDMVVCEGKDYISEKNNIVNIVE